METRWFYEIKDLDEPNSTLMNTSNTDVSIKSFYNKFKPNISDFQSNIITQWVITPFLKPEEGQSFQIPVPSKELLIYINDNIAGYFETVKGIYEDNILTMMRLSDLKVEYGNILRTNYSMNKNFINPVIRDFYLNNDFKVNPFGKIEAVDYEIIIEEFRKIATIQSNKSIDETLWEFLKRTHIEREGYIILSPQSWRFNNSLINSPFLEYISRYANRVILTVNKLNQHVRAVEIR